MKKVKKHTFLRMGGYAAALPGRCYVDSASSAILQSRASRTQWPNGPAMPTLRLALLEVARATPTDNFALLALKGRQSTDGGERSVTPGHVPPPSPCPLPRDAREGVLLICRKSGAARCLPPSVICRPFRACALTRKGRENSRTSTTTRTSRTRHDIYAQQAHADEKWRRAHFEQRARLCDSWKILRSLPLSPKIGVKRPALSRGAGAAQAPARRKGVIAGHGVPWRPR